MLIDSHAHIYMPVFDKDRDQVLARAREKGVGAIVNVGVDLESSRTSLKMAQDYPEVFATVGFHPNDTLRIAEGDLELLAELSQRDKVVAIGEIGLDFYRKTSPHRRQREVFREQLGLAAELALPVVIHCRNAHNEVLDILTGWVKSRPSSFAGRGEVGVMHCFSGDVELARRYIELGFLVSLSGPVTYPSASDQVEVARELPLGKLMVETDSPFLAPQLYRGQRNEPSYVSLVVDRIAQLRGVTVEVVAQATMQNAIRFFRLPSN
ncbi:TatD family hydrolase [Chloroflexota bacterium]